VLYYEAGVVNDLLLLVVVVPCYKMK